MINTKIRATPPRARLDGHEPAAVEVILRERGPRCTDEICAVLTPAEAREMAAALLSAALDADDANKRSET